jgi:hypothetical protein
MNVVPVELEFALLVMNARLNVRGMLISKVKDETDLVEDKLAIKGG